MAAAEVHVSTYTVKSMTGDLYMVDVPTNYLIHLSWIRLKIEEINPNIPHYLQEIQNIDPTTGDPFTIPQHITPESELCLVVHTPNVILRNENQWTTHPATHTVSVYTIHVFVDKLRCRLFKFLHHPKGFYLFRPRDMDKYVCDLRREIESNQTTFYPTLAEALHPIPEIIRDQVIHKWDHGEIRSMYSRLPEYDSDDDEE